MEEMKITRLVKYLKDTWYNHPKHKNISLELKLKLYEAYFEKIKSMSKNKFCDYLKPFWISKTSIKEIISILDKNKPKSLDYSFWLEQENNNYKKRYKETSRTKKVDQLSQKQVDYLIKLREDEPNKWYKLFDNGLFIPENKEEYQKIFKEKYVSKRLFYDAIDKYNIE